MNDADARTPLSQLLASMTLDNDVSHVHVPDDWLQGRAIYGGLTGVLALILIVAGDRPFVAP